MSNPTLIPLVAAERAAIRISSQSTWQDNRWIVDESVPGRLASQNVIDWNFLMPDGSRFHDSAWSEFREAAKVYLWSRHADPPPQRRPCHLRSLPPFFPRLRVLILWMARHGYHAFTDLDTHAANTFFAYAANRPSKDDLQSPINPHSLKHYSILLQDLHRQGQRYPALEIQYPLAAAQFTPPQSLLGSLPHTPDEIAIPLIKAAIRLIGSPADDVIRLYRTAQSAYDAALHEDRGRKTSGRRALASISDFRFSSLSGEQLPCHSVPITGTHQINFLVDRIYDAVFVLVSYLVGMRASEILGLQSGCVQPDTGSDPTTDLFFISGRIHKMSTSPAGDPHRWVAPSCVARAIAVLEQLSEPLRSRTGRSDLWLATGGAGHLSAASSVQIISVLSVSRRLNKQFAPFVDLPLYNGQPWKHSTHQGRKTFARFIGRRDPTGLDALRDHLGHKSILMTDRGYVGQDASLGDLVDHIVQEEMCGALTELLTARKLAGAAGERITRRSPYRGRVIDQDVHEFAAFLLRDPNTTLSICEFGYCLYRRSTSACRGDDVGPNPVFRTPSTCAQCHNFAVTQKHLSYWLARRERNVEMLQHPELTASSRSEAQRIITECDEIIAQLNSTHEQENAEHAPQSPESL